MDREMDAQGRFTLIRKLGEGGMGEVWLAHDELLRRHVALKRIRAADGHGSLEREARALAALRHPNVVAIHDIVRVDGEQYLATDFVDGHSLAESLRDGARFSEEEIRRIGAEIADGLAFAHSNGILHNDVKPSNVLIDQAGKAYLTDFGVACSDQTTASLSAPGSVMGTVGYLAPELFDGDQPSPFTDQYALGATLFEAATGRPPFAAGPAGIAQRLTRPATPVSTLAPEFSREFDHSISRALARAPSERFGSLGAFAAALRGENTERIPISPRPGGRPRRWPAALVLAGLAAALLATAAWRAEVTTGSGGAKDALLAGVQPTAASEATGMGVSPTPSAPTNSTAAQEPATPPPTVVPTETPAPDRIRVVVAPPQPDHGKKGAPGEEHGKDH